MKKAFALALALFGSYMAIAQTPAEPKHRVVFQLSEAEGSGVAVSRDPRQ